MTVVEFLQKKISERGISISELSRRTAIPRNYLYCSLGPKPSRALRADELIDIFRFFGLELTDYVEARNDENNSE